MATGIQQRSVLLLGASRRVLDDCVASSATPPMRPTTSSATSPAGSTSPASTSSRWAGKSPSGDHTIPVPRHIPPLAATPTGPRPAAWFATVEIGAAIYNFSIAAGQ
jgi:hypothetical protein